jgi:hypothetical protein
MLFAKGSICPVVNSACSASPLTAVPAHPKGQKISRWNKKRAHRQTRTNWILMVAILVVASVWFYHLLSMRDYLNSIRALVLPTSGVLPSAPAITPKASFNARYRQMRSLVDKVFLCRLFPTICDKSIRSKRLLYSLASQASMHRHIWGVGGLTLTVLVFACLIVGLRLRFLSSIRAEISGPDIFCEDENDRQKMQTSRYLSSLLKFWTERLTFTSPTVTFKIFVAVLLALELNNIMVPEQNILAVPEIVALMRQFPSRKEFVPPFAEWFMPGLQDSTAELWVWRLQIVRNCLILSWLVFLALPSKKYQVVCGVSYAAGAVLYFYFGAIGLMYNPCHSVQGPVLFILISATSVPFLDTHERSARWLRMSLYIGIFFPLYLFSGISKVRYEGVAANFTGDWLKKFLTEPDQVRSALPFMFQFVRENASARLVMTVGNLFLELILPFLLLFQLDNYLVRAMFHAVSLLFHISIFFLLGPNFARLMWMHVLAMDPLSWGSSTSTRILRPPSGRADALDWFRAALVMVILFAWFFVHFLADYLHLTGQIDIDKKRNPYFPFPELSMFAEPVAPNYWASLILVLFSFAALLWATCCFSPVQPTTLIAHQA